MDDNDQKKDGRGKAQKVLAANGRDLMAKIAEEVRTMRKMGRPTKFTPEIAEDLLLYLRSGLAFEDACREIGVSDQTVRDWCKVREEFAVEFEAARELGMESLESRMINIQSGGSLSTGDRARDRDLVKLLIWIMSKRNNRYADRLDITSGGKPFQIVHLPDDDILDADFVEVAAIEDNSQE
ncbi:hypothetical protein ASE85_03380 [Sphingobium sp. Leaf26]|uniref:terminase small subunit-like protein n=1 Tax=Sphingobium sp. Leaf26 TaxID=1735693 RepID=UPI000701E7A2|nr:hypothetical protein [Sphingobium sp. Leaf26]KQN09986.1 hypothetical protein ASE85_03380 [Sphingobium sp. Leaf26]